MPNTGWKKKAEGKKTDKSKDERKNADEVSKKESTKEVGKKGKDFVHRQMDKDKKDLLEQVSRVRKENQEKKGAEEEKTDKVNKSASTMFAEMRAARNAKNNLVTDETGKVDIVKTSTHSLFECRMGRRR